MCQHNLTYCLRKLSIVKTITFHNCSEGAVHSLRGVDSGQGWHLPDSMSFCSWRSCQLASYDERKFWGWLFVSIGSVFLVGYYCFLMPLTLPIVVVAVYFHWLSMKMFKHA